MAHIDPGVLSDVIFQIYSASRHGDVLDFQRRAIESIEHLVKFDTAWWGRGTAINDENRVHGSFAYQLPADIAQRLNLTSKDNLVAKRVVSAPGVVHYFGREELHSHESTGAFSHYMEISQCVAIAELDPSTGITSFLTLGRRKETPTFSEIDRTVVGLLTPHLTAAMNMAFADQLTALRNPERVALLATDALGSLRVAEPGAMSLIRKEWPGWVGPLLPAPLVARIAAKQPEHLGRHLHASVRWSGDHVFVSVRQREARDLLTKQEHAVANAFATGQSYKEVAESLGLSPATVRHHLRSAYVKLGVNDKAEFATRLGEL